MNANSENVRAVVLAAGNATRLAASGIEMHKPLLRIGKRSLIHGVIRRLHETGINEILVVTRPDISSSLTEEVQYIARQYDETLNILLESADTASSAESLSCAVHNLDPQPTYAVACDAIWGQDMTRVFCQQAVRSCTKGAAACVAVTRGCDLSPLEHSPTAIHSVAELAGTPLCPIRSVQKRSNVSGVAWRMLGPILFSPLALKALADGQRYSGITDFIQCLISEGRIVTCYDIGPAVDVDTAEDVSIAITCRLLP
jgi:NDP-sugar pyrophosphorylase family protein